MVKEKANKKEERQRGKTGKHRHMQAISQKSLILTLLYKDMVKSVYVPEVAITMQADSNLELEECPQ